MKTIEKIEQAMISMGHSLERFEISINFNEHCMEYVDLKTALERSVKDAHSLYAPSWVNEQAAEQAVKHNQAWSLNIFYEDEEEEYQTIIHKDGYRLSDVLLTIPALTHDDCALELIERLETGLLSLIKGDFGNLSINYQAHYCDDYEEIVEVFDLNSEQTQGMLWHIKVYPNAPRGPYDVYGLTLAQAFEKLDLGALIQYHELNQKLDIKEKHTVSKI